MLDWNVWGKRVVAIAIIVMVGFLATGYLLDSSGIRVTITNSTDQSIVAYARLNLSYSPYIETRGPFTIPSHSSIAITTWHLKPGTHGISVGWGEGNRSDGFQWRFSDDYHLLPWMTKTVRLNATLG